MDQNLIRDLTSLWAKSFFLQPVLIIAFILGFVIALIRNNGEQERIFFIPYFFIGTALFVFVYPPILYRIFTPKEAAIVTETANTVFELLEFIAFYYFFKNSLCHKTVKKILIPFLIFLVIIGSAFLVAVNFSEYTVDDINKHSYLINVIEFFFLFIMCLMYFYELFRMAPKMNLSERPSFLIVTSTFFYSTLMIPFFLLAYDIWKIEKSTFFTLYSCHLVLLVIMLIAILKGFLCKTRITI